MALARAVQAPLLAGRRMLGLPSTLLARRAGLSWHLDLREGIDFSVFLLGSFEPATVRALARLVHPGYVVLDVGANVGTHTLPLARRVGPEGRVVAVEPTAWAFDRLERNLALNPSLADRVLPRQTMLLERDDARPPDAVEASWPLAGGSDVHPRLRGRAVATIGCNVATLDGLVRREGLARLDLVKLDVDGWECAVLEGARETLARHRPLIVMELQPYTLAEKGRSVGDLLAIFDRAGYGLYDLRRPRRRLAHRGRLRIRIPEGASDNVLARPLG